MVGSGGREHALIKKLLESDKVTVVFQEMQKLLIFL